jgi:hypothetical protein
VVAIDEDDRLIGRYVRHVHTGPTEQKSVSGILITIEVPDKGMLKGS